MDSYNRLLEIGVELERLRSNSLSFEDDQEVLTVLAALKRLLDRRCEVYLDDANMEAAE